MASVAEKPPVARRPLGPWTPRIRESFRGVPNGPMSWTQSRWIITVRQAVLMSLRSMMLLAGQPNHPWSQPATLARAAGSGEPDLATCGTVCQETESARSDTFSNRTDVVQS
jgi:hypothetical protein